MLAVDSIRPAAAARTGIRIRPYLADLEPAVQEFNARLAARGVTYRFPETHLSPWLPAIPGRSVTQEYYLAVDGTNAVRGAYILKHQPFQIGPACIPVGFYHLPLSEGLIDPRYGLLGVQLLADALKRQPDMFVLGIGSFEEPLARMLQSLGWQLRPVPFYFKVLRPFRFARHIQHLRSSSARGLLFDAAAFTGGAWAAVSILQFRPHRWRAQVSSGIVERFDGWADDLWHRVRAHYSFVGARDSVTLNTLYSPGSGRFIRVKVTRDGRALGWVVVLDTQMRNHRYFGDLRVGTIVDCLAEPGSERAVMQQGTDVLAELGGDLIVSNQSARSWGDALRSLGFLQGPSGFLFGTSRSLSRRLGSSEASFPRMHLTRGDGDGPINL